MAPPSLGEAVSPTAASASIRPLALGFSPKGRSRETFRRSWTAPAVAPRGSVCQHPKVALSQLVPARSMGTLITKKGSAAVSKRSPCIAGNTVARSDPIPPFYVVATTGRWPDSCLGPIPCNVARLLRFPIILGGGDRRTGGLLNIASRRGGVRYRCSPRRRPLVLKGLHGRMA